MNQYDKPPENILYFTLIDMTFSFDSNPSCIALSFFIPPCSCHILYASIKGKFNWVGVLPCEYFRGAAVIYCLLRGQ